MIPVMIFISCLYDSFNEFYTGPEQILATQSYCPQSHQSFFIYLFYYSCVGTMQYHRKVIDDRWRIRSKWQTPTPGHTLHETFPNYVGLTEEAECEELQNT